MIRRAVRSIYNAVPLKRPLFGFVRNRLGIVPPFFQHLHFRGPFALKIDGDHRITVFSEGHIVENELFWLGFGNGWEGTSLQLWHRICRGRRGLILDIGANNGVYALVAAKLAPDATVIAFEPMARVAQDLRRNVELNGLPIRIEQRAVSDRDGTVAIFDDGGDYNYSASIEGQGTRRVDVEVCSVDRYLADQPDAKVAAIKIDVERHEPAAIAGMAKMLARDRPAILIEILDERIGEAVASQIADIGYRMFHIIEGKGIVPAAKLAPQEGHDWNCLLVTPDEFDRLRLADFLIDQGPNQ